MAQQLQNVTINAPAFGGINTQDSPVGLDPSYASVATNCVIDKLGRVGARKGSVLLSTATNTAGASSVGTNTVKIQTIFESLDKSGDKVVFSAGNNKIFSGTSTLTDITPSGYTISANNWKVVNFNDHVYFYQRGHEPLVYTDSGSQGLVKLSVVTGFDAPNGVFGVYNVTATASETTTLVVADGTTTVSIGSATYSSIDAQVTAIQGGSNYSNLLFTVAKNDAGDGFKFTYKTTGAVSTAPTLTGSGSSHTVSVITAGSADAPYQANEVLAAFGRLWIADITNNKHTIYWSDTLNGNDWNGGATGAIDLTSVWPTGHDEIVALAAHNGFLIVFGKVSIVVYKGAEDVVTSGVFKLHDTVEGVGCVARDSVQHTGTDIIFLSDSGVRSFGRVIQEKSMPMRDISRNVRNDLVRYVNEERIANSTLAPVKSMYSPEEAFYLLTLPNNNITYCFDMRQALPDGSHRVTTWSTPIALCYTRTQDGKIYMGRQGGIYEYRGFTDKLCTLVGSTQTYSTSSYQLAYFSNPLDFGNSSNIKFLKKFKMTIIGDAAAQSVLNWGYDYSDSYYKQTFISGKTNATTAFYGVAEYGISSVNTPVGATADFTEKLVDPTNPSGARVPATEPSFEYSLGTEIQVPNVQGSGHGTTVTVGLESTISGSEFSIQKIDINVLLGRLI